MPSIETLRRFFQKDNPATFYHPRSARLWPTILKSIDYRVAPKPRWVFWASAVTAPWGVIYGGEQFSQRHDVQWHELTHGVQQRHFAGGGWWGPWLWAACYVLNPWFRLREEMVAEAVEAAIRARDAGSVEVSEVAALVSHRLGGWRAPYFTPGNPDTLTWQIAEVAAAAYPTCEDCRLYLGYHAEDIAGADGIQITAAGHHPECSRFSGDVL